MVHRKDSFEIMTPVVAILFICIALLFLGGGKFKLIKNK